MLLLLAALDAADYMEKAAEADRALGASAVLGTDRLDVAELQRIPLWQAALSVVADVGGYALEQIVGAISAASKEAALARSSELL